MQDTQSHPEARDTQARCAHESNQAKTDKQRGGFPFTIVRRCVQIAILLLFIAPLPFAGWGLFGSFTGSDTVINTPSTFALFGSLSASGLFGVSLVDPFAALQVIASSKSITPSLLIGALPVLVVYGLIRGRAFCGWACPVNLLLEIIDALRKKLHIKVSETVMPRRTKAFIALGVIIVSALVSIPVFEVVSPISAINKGIALGSTVGIVTLIAVILVELFWGHRVWCRSICPLGGFWEVVGKVGLINVKIDHDACIGCNKCKRACLCSPEILDDAISGADTIVRAGDCQLCGKCIESCPTQALGLKIGK